MRGKVKGEEVGKRRKGEGDSEIKSGRWKGREETGEGGGRLEGKRGKGKKLIIITASVP
jgi:hypothetical protein